MRGGNVSSAPESAALLGQRAVRAVKGFGCGARTGGGRKGKRRYHWGIGLDVGSGRAGVFFSTELAKRPFRSCRADCVSAGESWQ